MGSLETSRRENKCHVFSDPWATAVVTTVPGLLSECKLLRVEH